MECSYAKVTFTPHLLKYRCENISLFRCLNCGDGICKHHMIPCEVRDGWLCEACYNIGVILGGKREGVACDEITELGKLIESYTSNTSSNFTVETLDASSGISLEQNPQ